MGQKINPISIRIGITRNWSSNWFTSDKMELLESIHDHIASYKEVGNVTSFATMLKVGKIINGGKPLDIIQLAILYEELPQEYKKLIIGFDPKLHNEKQLSFLFDINNLIVKRTIPIFVI